MIHQLDKTEKVNCIYSGRCSQLNMGTSEGETSRAGLRWHKRFNFSFRLWRAAFLRCLVSLYLTSKWSLNNWGKFSSGQGQSLFFLCGCRSGWEDFRGTIFHWQVYFSEPPFNNLLDSSHLKQIFQMVPLTCRNLQINLLQLWCYYVLV